MKVTGHGLTRRHFIAGSAVLGAAALTGVATAISRAQTTRCDLLIYGSTVAAFAAAIQARRMGASVIILSPEPTLGGMTTSGLGWTDIKFAEAIGGLAREFYERLYTHYSTESAWISPEVRSEYEKVRAQPGPVIAHDSGTFWNFEPSAASAVLETWLSETDVRVVYERLDRARGVSLNSNRIEAIRTEGGSAYSAATYIDATYEGDLMAAAGVPHRVGRESQAEFGEEHAGVRYNPIHFEGISPYRGEGDEALLTYIAGTGTTAQSGQADALVQAYCFRLSMSWDENNQVPLVKPEGYRSSDFELMYRYLQRNPDALPFTTKTPIPNRKLDANNGGPFGFDFVNGNRTSSGGSWADASYAKRDQVWRAHKHYQMSYLWAVNTEERVPAAVRDEANRWRLAADEFTGSNGWPEQLYVREARRMEGMNTITEHHLVDPARVGQIDSVGMGSYSMDSHALRRVVVDGQLCTEGSFYQRLDGPWQIPYGAMVPRRGSVENLLVTCAVSSTHAAYGSLRMEPTFMIMGQAAATAAVLAIDAGVSAQDLGYDSLAAQLTRDGQVLASAA
jgi:hypothetical protein